MKGRLSDAEKSKFLGLAETLVKKEDMVSLCAYGSRVAGFATKDSDYEMIVVTKKPALSAAGMPVKDSSHSPPVVTDEDALLKDAKQASVAEFVVGRLLNIYEPIINGDFLGEVEVEYKKRVMVDELMEIQLDYGDFSSNLVIPFEYFLFKKLHSRAIVYPEAMFSYARTYACDYSKENIEFALGGFRQAGESLASSGIMGVSEDAATIFRGKKRRDAFYKLRKMMPLTTRGTIRFAVHGLANRAGYGFKTEPLSKLKMMGRVKSMDELDRPIKLLRREEGVIFDDPDKLVEELAHMSGFGETYQHERKKKGDFVNSTQQLEIWDDERKVKYVLKHFPELKSAKWALLNLWSLASKRFNMSPLSRLNREVDGVRRMRELGLKTHRIIGIVLSERTLVTEYVEGVPLSKFVEKVITGRSGDTANIEKYGQVLAKLHKSGLVYGDTKPQNVLVGKNGIDLLDLEQTVENGDKAWDLAEFLYFASTHLEKEKGPEAGTTKQQWTKEEGMKLVAESFLGAYQSENGNEVIRKARNLRYLIPFLPVLTPKMIRVVRRAMREYSTARDSGPRSSG